MVMPSLDNISVIPVIDIKKSLWFFGAFHKKNTCCFAVRA